jgi:hypothetical protein
MASRTDFANQEANILDLYESDKRRIISYGTELKTTAYDLGNSSEVLTLGRIVRELEEDRFYLAVLGNFKRGKSTLVNALLGAPILPTGIIPLTSVVTKIQYGMIDEAIIQYNGGRTESVPLESIGDYITERGNPDNIRGIGEVDLLVNCPLLQKGVVLVDTPGIGSTYLSNTRTTYDFLSKLDAAVVVIGSDPPISQNELELIKEVNVLVEKVFLVQNKIDCMSERDWKEAMLFSQSVLASSIGPGVRLYPLSSKNGLIAKQDGDRERLSQSGLPALENDLQQFIVNDSKHLLIRSSSRKLMRSLTDLRTAVDLQSRVLNDTSEALKSKIDWLQSENTTLKRKMDEQDYFIDGGLDRIIKELERELEAFKKANKPELLSKLETFVDDLDSKLSPRAYAEQIERFISETMVASFSSFIDKQELIVADSLKDIVQRSEKQFDSLDEKLRRDVSTTFGIEHQHAPPFSSDLGKSKIYFDRASMLNYQSIIPAEMPFLLPRPLYQRAMRKKALITIVDELDKYGGKMRYDIVYRLSENARKVKSELRSRMLVTLQTMNEAIRSGMLTREKADEGRLQKTQEISAMRAKLDAIGSDLSSIAQLSLS